MFLISGVNLPPPTPFPYILHPPPPHLPLSVLDLSAHQFVLLCVSLTCNNWSLMCMHIRAYTVTHTSTHMPMHMHEHVNTLASTHIHTHIHTHTHTHACMHAHKQFMDYVNTHACFPSLSLFNLGFQAGKQAEVQMHSHTSTGTHIQTPLKSYVLMCTQFQVHTLFLCVFACHFVSLSSSLSLSLSLTLFFFFGGGGLLCCCFF